MQRHAILLVLCIVLFAPAAYASPPQHMTWTVDGVTREALVYVPPSVNQTSVAVPLPLVFAFHGRGGNAIAAANGMALQNVWPQAVVVYMQGLPSIAVSPNVSGLAPGWQFEPGQSGDRDLKFFDAALATMRQTYPIDPRRIYASGFSEGAFFTLVLWSQRSQVLAALAGCAVSIIPPLQLTAPRAYMQIAGQADPLVPIANQLATIDAIKQLDGATGAAQACGPLCKWYASPSGTDVVAIIHPGGHVYPPAASGRIVTFFKNHMHP